MRSARVGRLGDPPLPARRDPHREPDWPRGTVRIEPKTQETGAFIRDHLQIEHGVTLKLDSALT